MKPFYCSGPHRFHYVSSTRLYTNLYAVQQHSGCHHSLPGQQVWRQNLEAHYPGGLSTGRLLLSHLLMRGQPSCWDSWLTVKQSFFSPLPPTWPKNGTNSVYLSVCQPAPWSSVAQFISALFHLLEVKNQLPVRADNNHELSWDCDRLFLCCNQL